MPTTTDLLSLLNEDFFTLVPTKRKLMLFARVFITAYCKENNLPLTEIQTYDMQGVGYARYSFKTNKILISKDFTRIYERLAQEKNCYFLYQFFDTLLHELRHHAQYHSSKINPLIKINHEIEKYSVFIFPYNYSPEEMDARYHAYTTLKNLKPLEKYYKSPQYVNDEMEIQNSSATGLIGFIKGDYKKNFKKVLPYKKEFVEYITNLAINNNCSTDFENYNELDEDKIEHCIAKDISPQFLDTNFAEINKDEEVNAKISQETKQFFNLFDEKRRDDLFKNLDD